MLAIRMQRTGRKGHAMFRVVVQDSRLTPTSGRVVAQLGHYDPHAKTVVIDKEQAAVFLSNGAQPSDRVARMLQKEGVKLPDWVTISANKNRSLKNAEKLRSNQPKVEAPAEEPAADVTEAPVDAPEAEVTAEAPVEEAKEETKDEPAEEKAA